MKILYFDCFSGISGDMTLGALLDLGLDKELLVSELKTLGLEGWDIEFGRSVKNGISAYSVEVHHELSHEHRHLSDIVSLIDASDGISPGAKSAAKAIFKRVAVAEGRVHGALPEEVHFHEVGAVDSIIDIVGTAILIDKLAPDKIICSRVNDGSGFTHCQHGKIPVPVPAVLEIFADSGMRLRCTDIPAELVTPTGAAILAELSGQTSAVPPMRVIKTGYGAGSRDLEIPNVLRVVLGESEEQDSRQTITVIETNLDDLSPEILGYTMERLLEAGAADVFFQPIQMKKNRPAVKMTVLCSRDLLKRMTDIIFSETTTIGLRIRDESRICLNREMKNLETPYGLLKVKEVKTKAGHRYSPEYEDAKLLAQRNGVPLKEIYAAAEAFGRR